MSTPPPLEAPAGLRRVAIVGGGCAGWMAAAMLAPLAAAGTRITLIDSPAERDLPPAAALLPGAKAWHALLGMDEHALLADAQGTYRLGTHFSNWAGGIWLLPFGDYGSSIDGIAFADLWLRARASGWPRPLDDYNLAALAAATDKFVRPTPDRVAMLDYGYHVDRTAYAAHLRRHGERLDIETLPGAVVRVERGQDGTILALHLDTGARLEADFFVDAGDAGALLGESACENWSGYFTQDRVASIAGGGDANLTPLTGALGIERGWLQRIPLQTRSGWTAHFAASDEAAAIDALTRAAGTAEGLAITALPSTRRTRPWTGNCVAIGRAAGTIAPVFADPIDIARIALSALRDLLPHRGDMAVLADAYNDAMAREWEALRDLSLLLVPVGTGEPASLTRKLRLFREAGRLPASGTISQAMWLAGFLGRNIQPRSWTPLADAIGAERLEQNMIRLASLFAQSAEAMPRHADYITRFCKAMSD